MFSKALTLLKSFRCNFRTEFNFFYYFFENIKKIWQSVYCHKKKVDLNRRKLGLPHFGSKVYSKLNFNEKTLISIHRKIRIQYQKFMTAIRHRQIRSVFILLSFFMILVYKMLEISLAVFFSNQILIIPTKSDAVTLGKNLQGLSQTQKIKNGPTLKVLFWNRKKHLEQACKKSNSTKSVSDISITQFSHIYINKKLKFLYCGFRRTGLVNWKRVLQKMIGKTNAAIIEHIRDPEFYDVKNFQYFNQLTDKEKEEAVTSYTKFIVTRHPLERLLSIYTELLHSRFANKETREMWVRAIVKYVKKKELPKTLYNYNEPDIKFADFIRFLLLFTTESRRNAVEWTNFQGPFQTMDEMCFPCAIKYNYIGDFDNIERDSNFVLKMIGSNILFPADSSFFPSKIKERMKRHYRNFPRNLVTYIRKYYENDMQFFGYS